ncbi:hypothetical protein E5545_09815 [Salmonella enterica]|nr:hypothetical protein [Salmonella enterica]
MCAALKRCAYRHKGKIMENTNIVTSEQQAPNTISASNVKRGELFKIDLQLIQDNQKRHNGELFKIKFAVV